VQHLGTGVLGELGHPVAGFAALVVPGDPVEGLVQQRVAEAVAVHHNHPLVHHVDPLGQRQIQQQGAAQAVVQVHAVGQRGAVIGVREQGELFGKAHAENLSGHIGDPCSLASMPGPAE
jgi:hypothetical protein